MSDDKDKLVQKGTFTVRGYVILHNGKQVGTYEANSENQVTAKMTAGPLKGTLTLTRTPPSPNWTGELERQAGGKYKINVAFEKLR